MDWITNSKLFKGSKYQNKILAAIQDPINKPLVRQVTSYLDEKWDICVRGGYHCAPKKHESLGTLDQGAVRISLSYFNNISEIEHLISATKYFLRKMH